MKEGKTKFQYDHKTRKCEFPDCGRLGASQGKQHADGSLYRRAWCKFHLFGTGRVERVHYSRNIKKYIPKNINKPNEKI